jgi:hypothetical protein
MRPFNDLAKQDQLHQVDGNPERTKQQVEQCVILVRLELYNRGVPCGPKAVRERCRNFYHLTPLPSERTIGRILARNALTHGRAGVYNSKRNLAI